jgi:hypothetical protein
MGQDFKFTKASEPTDIIWENRHFTVAARFMRELLGYAIVVVILVLSFISILWLAKLKIDFANVFPAINCNIIEETYGTSIEKYAYYV